MGELSEYCSKKGSMTQKKAQVLLGLDYRYHRLRNLCFVNIFIINLKMFLFSLQVYKKGFYYNILHFLQLNKGAEIKRLEHSYSVIGVL